MPGQDEFLPNPSSIGAFNVGDISLDIKAAINNSSFKTSQWQFRYQPLFLPEFNSSKQLKTSEIYNFGAKYRFDFKLILDNEIARENAYIALSIAYPNEFPQISKQNIKALQVSKIEVDIPELNTISPTAIIVNRVFFTELLALSSISIAIEDSSKEKLNLIIEQIQFSQIVYNVELNAKSSTRNTINISFKKLVNTTLFAKLDGLPKNADGVTYIHRDDLRKLSENIQEQIDINATISDNETFQKDLINEMLKVWNQSDDIGTFNKEKLASTYNGKDLEPDEVTKTLEKIFDYDEDKKHYIHSGAVDLSGKANVFEVFSAEASVKGNYSSDELEESLKKHEIEVQFEGNKIVAKSIKVNRINLSDFKKETNIYSNLVYIKDKGLINLKNTLRISDASYSASFLDKSQIYNLPIGTILPFGGNYSQIQNNDLWMLCDGKSLRKTEFPELFNNIGSNWGSENENEFNLPDLRGYFLRGADAGANVDSDSKSRVAIFLNGSVGDNVGSYQSDATSLPKQGYIVSVNGAHNHTVTEMIYDNNIDGVDSALTHSYEHHNEQKYTSTSGDHSHTITGGDSETRPKNAYVNYIIRVK